MLNKTYRIASVFLATCLLSACAGKFVNKNSEEFDRFSCPIEQERCGAGEDDRRLLYTVETLSPTRFKVDGEVKFEWLSQGSRKWIEFYILFMDENTVVHEKKIKTTGRNATFNFEVETDKPITQTTFTDLKLWTRG